MLNFSSKRSELNRIPSEMSKPPRGFHSMPQKLMHGSEINKITKPAREKPKRHSLDLMRFVTMGAAAVVVAGSAAAAMKPAPEEYAIDYGKYHFFVSCPTYEMNINAGGYAAYLDFSTEDKREAFGDYCEDWLYGFSKLLTERGEEILLDSDVADGEHGPVLHSVYLSENRYGFGDYLSMGNIYGVHDNGRMEIPYIQCCLRYNSESGGFLNDDGYLKMDGRFPGREHCNISNLLEQADMIMGSAEDFVSAFSGLTRGDIHEKVAVGLEELFSDEQGAADLVSHSFAQFTVSGKGGSLIAPEFVKVVRDDDVFGYKKITLPNDGDYFMVFGTDEYPINQPWAARMEISRWDHYENHQEELPLPIMGSVYSSVTDHLENSLFKLCDFMEYSDRIFQSVSVIDSPDKPDYSDPDGKANVYYDIAAARAEEPVELIVPQLARLVKIEDVYRKVRLSDFNRTYTITNNGDHEAVFFTTLNVEGISGGFIRLPGGLSTRPETGQEIFYQPLKPGESVSVDIRSIGALWDITDYYVIPDCCSMVDETGRVYEPQNIAVDFVKGSAQNNG